MYIGRRDLLVGAASLGLAGTVGPLGLRPAEQDLAATTDRGWHPLTQSLLHRARRAGQRLDRPRVERIIREVSGERVQPIIKWMDSPRRAFEHLLRYPLSELTQMPAAQLWPFLSPIPAKNFDAEERSTELYLLATDVLKVEDHGRALMAPKLDFKARAIASKSRPEMAFEARAIAAEIGWIETSLPGAGAAAIRAVEDLLSAGHSDCLMEIHHQLCALEAFECGLHATWETPQELICLPAEATA